MKLRSIGAVDAASGPTGPPPPPTARARCPRPERARRTTAGGRACPVVRRRSSRTAPSAKRLRSTTQSVRRTPGSAQHKRDWRARAEAEPHATSAFMSAERQTATSAARARTSAARTRLVGGGCEAVAQHKRRSCAPSAKQLPNTTDRCGGANQCNMSAVGTCRCRALPNTTRLVRRRKQCAA